jgi:hypothetical protein
MGKPKTVEELFKGRHFDREVVILCVRWYLRFKLSLRDLVEMMAERGLSMAHTTIMRWVQRYAPEFEKRWRRFARAGGWSWRVDETYVKIRALVQIAGTSRQSLLRCAMFRPEAPRSRLQVQLDLERRDVAVRTVPCGCGVAARCRRS